jgi:opacity protein-like surface antigen
MIYLYFLTVFCGTQLFNNWRRGSHEAITPVHLNLPSEDVMKPAIVSFRPLTVAISVILFALGVPNSALAQFSESNLEFSGGYAHLSGDGGTNGLTGGVGLWLNRRVSLNFEYDSAWDTSNLGVFEFTSVGSTAVKSHIQNWMIGPRLFFPPKELKKYKFDPFANFLIGGSHLSQKIQQLNASQSASGDSFSWELGGGADYQFNSQWFGRLGLDLLRTHFANEGQSHLRLVLSVGYTFAPRATAK